MNVLKYALLTMLLVVSATFSSNVKAEVSYFNSYSEANSFCISNASTIICHNIEYFVHPALGPKWQVIYELINNNEEENEDEEEDPIDEEDDALPPCTLCPPTAPEDPPQ